MDEYLILGFTEASLEHQMNLYVVHKAYNNDFGDLVLLILARMFHINIIILDISMSGTVNEYTMYPREESTSSVVVQR